ncbi:MAG: PhzF family phenazine biosynthesis protein [Cypionkella sp.]
MLEFHTLDVFTDAAFTGNPLAVVLGADDLTPEQMQIIAREFNLSETIFVQAPQNPAHTARVRIFFPTAEIPFAGHPTIGCAIHLATACNNGDFDADLVLEEEAGLVPVTVRRRGAQTTAEFTAPVLPHAADFPAPETLIKQALGLQRLGFGSHRAGVFQGGPRFLYVPVASLADLAAARPQEPHWSELMQTCGVDSAYLYVVGTDCDYQARLFSPTAGIPEDPATGSASAILAAQLLTSGALVPGINRFHLRQGIEMGRPSTIHLTVDMDHTLRAVRIRGQAVAISSGRITIPQLPLGIAAKPA